MVTNLRPVSWSGPNTFAEGMRTEYMFPSYNDTPRGGLSNGYPHYPEMELLRMDPLLELLYAEFCRVQFSQRAANKLFSGRVPSRAYAVTST